MDSIDKKILAILQDDATIAIADLADRVGLSKTPCWRRIRNMEDQGVIRKRVTLLDRDKLNVGVTAFVSVRTNRHSDDWLETFAAAVRRHPEVVEFFRMSGEVDYLLRIVVPDIAAYDAFYRRLIKEVDMSDVSTSFALEEIKYTTALPLQYAE